MVRTQRGKLVILFFLKKKKYFFIVINQHEQQLLKPSAFHVLVLTVLPCQGVTGPRQQSESRHYAMPMLHSYRQLGRQKEREPTAVPLYLLLA